MHHVTTSIVFLTLVLLTHCIAPVLPILVLEATVLIAPVRTGSTSGSITSASSTVASSTSAGSTGAISNVLQAPLLETHCWWYHGAVYSDISSVCYGISDMSIGQWHSCLHALPEN